MSKNNQFTIDKVQTYGYSDVLKEQEAIKKEKAFTSFLNDLYHPDLSKSKFLI